MIGAGAMLALAILAMLSVGKPPYQFDEDEDGNTPQDLQAWIVESVGPGTAYNNRRMNLLASIGKYMNSQTTEQLEAFNADLCGRCK